MLKNLLQISLDELKNGYVYNSNHKTYTCLTCGKIFEIGEMFSINGKFYEALKAVQLHIEKEHDTILSTLTSFDKKYTGITDNQKELLYMISEGLSDNEIAKKTGVASATIRHQRFVFREKAKQAKLYLAIFEVVEKCASKMKGRSSEEEFIEVHHGAKMVDDRYFITKSEEEKIIAMVFDSIQPLKLKVFSHKEKKKIVILRRIATQFESGKKYTEIEVNAILKEIYDDYPTIRRYLIEYGFMERTNDCKEYWINE